jgi:hypothetical protein
MGEKRVGEDSGYIFTGPTVERGRKVVQPGVWLIDNHRNGVIVTDNPGSPWYKATYYAHGSILSDDEGLRDH